MLDYVTDTGSVAIEIAACFLISSIEFPNEFGFSRFEFTQLLFNYLARVFEDLAAFKIEQVKCLRVARVQACVS